jgi:hypothetical protein
MGIDYRACLRIQIKVVELGQSAGGEANATKTIESRTGLAATPDPWGTDS